MIDSHTHLDRLAEPAADAVARAEAQGVTRMLSVGTDGVSSRKVLALAEVHPQVWAAVGRHPNAANGFEDSDLAELRELAAHPRCLAIGETGLDYFRDSCPPEDQRRAFHAQIALARETGLPLIVHTRSADDETLEILGCEAGDLSVVMHCFSMPDRLAECLSHPRWSISFAGNVTYPKSADLRESAASVPLERLLVETDAPYLSPQEVRSQRNVPANVVLTARLIADQRGITYTELESAVDANAAAVFGW